MSTSLPNKYPHLLPEDARVWNDFRILHQPDHITFMYDVAVGEGRDPGPLFPDNIRTMGLRLSKRRLDVVGVKPDYVEIFEITQSAGLKAAGQALVYPHLLRVTWQVTLPIVTTILCRECQPDVRESLENFDIAIIVVESIPNAQEPRG